MKEHKELENMFVWLPPDKRKSKFGGMVTPIKSETRRPILWLARKANELYLVNSSDEKFDFVVADTGGFLTLEDDVVGAANKAPYRYKSVKPNFAVKIDEYDDYYDLDYILQVYIEIESKKLGLLEITSPAKKGGVGETVLIWDTGTYGKGVSIRKCKS